jgi:hypothetical protein
MKIAEELLPSSWVRSYLVDLQLKDGAIIKSIFIKPDGTMWGQADPKLGEPNRIYSQFDPRDIVAIKLRGGWRSYAILRHLFPHKWYYLKEKKGVSR